MVSRCPTCGRRAKRSTEANRRYWAILHDVSEQVKPEWVRYSAEVWHTYFKTKFLGAEEIKLPNGKTIIKPHSSADLDRGEFNDYMTQVEAWAAQRGIVLEFEV